MKQKKILLTGLILLFCGVLNAQNFYIKPYIQYHQSISSQVEPDFYLVVVAVPLDPKEGFLSIPNSPSKDFSLASGLKQGLTAGYTFQNNLGVELSADYFNRQKVFDKTKNYGYTRDWSYKATTFRPALTFTVNYKKTSFTGKAGPVLMLNNVEQSAYYNETKYTTCTFNTNLNWGYNVGFEYNYHLSNSFALVMELGSEQYNYTPKKSKVEYEWVYDPSTSSKKVLEIKYVSKITNEKVIDNYFQNVRFKESILFNSLYFGIGIKYTIGNK